MTNDPLGCVVVHPRMRSPKVRSRMTIDTAPARLWPPVLDGKRSSTDRFFCCSRMAFQLSCTCCHISTQRGRRTALRSIGGAVVHASHMRTMDGSIHLTALIPTVHACRKPRVFPWAFAWVFAHMYTLSLKGAAWA